MSVMTFTTEITKKQDASEIMTLENINPCITHGIIPKIFRVFTGKKKKFNGATAECKSEDCLCYDYDVEEVIAKWNKNNPLKH